MRITDARSGGFLTNGTLDLRDNLWWNFATNGVAVNVAGGGAALRQPSAIPPLISTLSPPPPMSG